MGIHCGRGFIALSMEVDAVPLDAGIIWNLDTIFRSRSVRSLTIWFLSIWTFWVESLQTLSVPHLAQLPYSQTTQDSTVELPGMRANAAVQALRDQVQADLVLLVGDFPGTCGLG